MVDSDEGLMDGYFRRQISVESNGDMKFGFLERRLGPHSNDDLHTLQAF